MCMYAHSQIHKHRTDQIAVVNQRVRMADAKVLLMLVAGAPCQSSMHSPVRSLGES